MMTNISFKPEDMTPQALADFIRENAKVGEVITVLGQDVYAVLLEENPKLNVLTLKRRVREWCEEHQFVYGWQGDFLEIYITKARLG